MQAQDEQLSQAVRHALQQQHTFQQIVQQAKVRFDCALQKQHIAMLQSPVSSCHALLLIQLVALQAHATASQHPIAELETSILQHLASQCANCAMSSCVRTSDNKS
jgi:hypothetical protein